MPPILPPPAAYATFKQAQSYTTLGRTTIEGLIRAGKLPACKIGRRVLIRFADLDHLLKPKPQAN
jgi:excisionase family DNA binding protein